MSDEPQASDERKAGRFQVGHRKPKSAGRKPGSPNKLPKGFTASIKRIFQEIGHKDPALYRKAIEKGLRAKPPKSFPYVQLAAHYIDGKPAERIELETTETRRFVVVLSSNEDPLADRMPAIREVPFTPRAALGGPEGPPPDM